MRSLAHSLFILLSKWRFPIACGLLLVWYVMREYPEQVNWYNALFAGIFPVYEPSHDDYSEESFGPRETKPASSVYAGAKYYTCRPEEFMEGEEPWIKELKKAVIRVKRILQAQPLCGYEQIKKWDFELDFRLNGWTCPQRKIMIIPDWNFWYHKWNYDDKECLLEVLVIHEIAHACTKNNHGQEWEKFMLNIAEIAKGQKQPKLEAALLGHVSWVLSNKKYCDAEKMYNRIASISSTKEQGSLLTDLAKEYQLTFGEFCILYPDAPKINDMGIQMRKQNLT